MTKPNENTNIVVQQTVRDTSYEDDRGNVVRQSEITVTYTADLLRADEPTANKHIYPRAVLQKAIEEYQQRVRNGTALGAVEPHDEIDISLHDVSHKLTSVELRDDGTVRVRAETLQTPQGKMLAGLIQGGVVQLHPAGMGSRSADGRVRADYTLRSFDFYYTLPKEPAK